MNIYTYFKKYLLQWIFFSFLCIPAFANRSNPVEVKDDRSFSCTNLALPKPVVTVELNLAIANSYQAFWNVLVEQERANKFSFLKKNHSEIKILNLACGAGYESPMLASFFGTGRYLDVDHTGAFVDNIEIGGYTANMIQRGIHYRKEVMESYPDTQKLLSAVHDHVADASDPETYKGLPAKDDFI